MACGENRRSKKTEYGKIVIAIESCYLKAEERTVMVLVFYGYAFVLHIHRISMAGEEVYEFHTRIAKQEKHCQAYGKKYSTQLSKHNS